jgi:hypothetical protein
MGGVSSLSSSLIGRLWFSRSGSKHHSASPIPPRKVANQTTHAAIKKVHPQPLAYRYARARNRQSNIPENTYAAQPVARRQRGSTDFMRIAFYSPPSNTSMRRPREKLAELPQVSRYARVTGLRRRRAIRRQSRRAANRAAARRAARDIRPIKSAIVASVAPTGGPRGWRRPEARVTKSEHDPVEINPPDDRLDHPRMPVRREEIDSPSRAFGESLRETHFGATAAQVNQWKSQQLALARFKNDCPTARLAGVPPRLRRLPPCRLPARLLGEHGGWVYRRHRASHRSGDTLKGSRALSSHAIFALSTGLPTMGGAMLGQPIRHVTPRKERERLAEYLK